MLKALICAAIVLILVFGYSRYLESKSLFFPSKESKLTPAFINLPFEEVYLKTPDHMRLHSWLIPANAKYTLLLCHGNAGNISTRLEKIALLHEAGVNVFIFDYRGYGRSQGRPSESGIYLDARSAYDYLVEERKIAPESVIIYGESLGGAVAVDLAAQVKNAGLISESTFSRAQDMARRFYPFLPAFIFSVKFDSLSKIKNVASPKLFIHSREDEIIPLGLAKKLYAAAKEPKYFVEISGPHNLAFLESKDKYTAAIKSFIGSM